MDFVNPYTIKFPDGYEGKLLAFTSHDLNDHRMVVFKIVYNERTGAKPVDHFIVRGRSMAEVTERAKAEIPKRN